MKPMKKDVSKIDKSSYVRKPAGLNVAQHPGNRTPEGSVLTGGSAKSGPIQPHRRTSTQKVSSKIKGGAD